MGVVIYSKRHVFNKLLKEAVIGEIVVRHVHCPNEVFKVHIDNVEGRRLKEWEFSEEGVSDSWWEYASDMIKQEANIPDSIYLVPQHLMDISNNEAKELALFFNQFLK